MAEIWQALSLIWLFLKDSVWIKRKKSICLQSIFLQGDKMRPAKSLFSACEPNTLVNDQLSYKRVCLTNNRLPLWSIFKRAHVRKLHLDWRELTWKVQFDMLSGLGAVLNRDDYVCLIVLWIHGIKQKWIWFLSDEHDSDKNKKKDSSW